MYKYLLGIILCFIACKKDEPTLHKQIKGVVVNAITKQPVAGQQVKLSITTQKIVRTNDPEWPSGMPVYSHMEYQTISDKAGEYLFDVRIPNLPWQYISFVPRGEFIMTYSFIRLFPIDESVTKLEDSIFIERPGYVRYTIKTLGAKENEFLSVTTARSAFQSNWVFPGKVDKVLLDTIPAESNPDPEVEWWRIVRTVVADTITYKKDTIHIHAGSITNYSIQY